MVTKLDEVLVIIEENLSKLFELVQDYEEKFPLGPINLRKLKEIELSVGAVKNTIKKGRLGLLIKNLGQISQDILVSRPIGNCTPTILIG